MQELQSIKDLFLTKLFRIPNYQRGYAWQKEQLQDFWKDANRLPNGKNHYTGALSLKAIKDTTGKEWSEERWLLNSQNVKPFHIVDGQQRLTTCVIFIQSVVAFFETKNPNIELNHQSLSEVKRHYLYQKNPKGVSVAYKFGYEVDNPSFEFLQKKIFANDKYANVQETFYTANLEKAKKFFDEKISSLYAQEGENAVLVLFDKITHHFLLNVYEISDDFNVFVAFEAMNNRGKSLSNLELLKNRILYLITLYDDKVDEDEKTTLTNLVNNAWSELYHQLGKNKNHPLKDDDFLKNYWIIYFYDGKKKGDNYINYFLNTKFTSEAIYNYNKDENQGLSPENIQKHIENLKVLSQHWYHIHFPDTCQTYSAEEKLWLERINRLGVRYFRPLIVALFLKNSRLTSDDRVDILKKIERFIFVHFKLSFNYYNSGQASFYNLAHTIAVNKKERQDIVDAITQQIETTLRHNFKNTDGGALFKADDLISRVSKNEDLFYGWSGLNYFLYEYEYSLFCRNGNQKVDWQSFAKSDDNDKTSIEHIYPKNPKDEDWTDFIAFTETEKKFLKGSLGNLLPLSLSINTSLKNNSFANKKVRNLMKKVKRHGEATSKALIVRLKLPNTTVGLPTPSSKGV